MGTEALEVGYDVPAQPGMPLDEVQTPALILDLDALEQNLRHMAARARQMGVALRPHGKMHKSVDVARLQAEIGGAQGLCCQKVSEAEAFVRGGILDVLISNQVRDRAKLARLAQLAGRARLSVCVDDVEGVRDLAEAIAGTGRQTGTEADTRLDVLVEVDIGAGRCGVVDADAAVAVARAVAEAKGLRFAGLQAYHGTMQHIPTLTERRATFQAAQTLLTGIRDAVLAAGLPCAVITGGGTGSFAFEGESGLWTELQCGSYAFMDADYGRIEGEDGARLDGTWCNALFVLTGIMSTARAGQAVCDAGLKALAVDSGLPQVFGRAGVTYLGASDEHGVIADPGDALRAGERLRLVPGHCDPTCNLHDWYVGIRDDRVECLWPVSARGKVF